MTHNNDDTQAIINELIDTLNGIEAERAFRATAILKSYGKLLVAIAYKLAPDVERMLVEDGGGSHLPP